MNRLAASALAAGFFIALAAGSVPSQARIITNGTSPDGAASAWASARAGQPAITGVVLPSGQIVDLR